MSDDGYRADVALDDRGDLVITGAGDLAVIDGPRNAAQALLWRLRTQRGELPLHPAYGSLLAQRLVGIKVDLALTRAQAALELREMVAADARFALVTNIDVRRVAVPLSMPVSLPGPGLTATVGHPAGLQPGTVNLELDAAGHVTAIAYEPGPGVTIGTAAPSALAVDELYVRVDATGQPFELYTEPGTRELVGVGQPAALALGVTFYSDTTGDGQTDVVYAQPLERTFAAVASTVAWRTAVAVRADVVLGAGETVTIGDLAGDLTLGDLTVLPTTVDEVLAVAPVDPSGALTDDELADLLPDFEGQPDTDLDEDLT